MSFQNSLIPQNDGFDVISVSPNTFKFFSQKMHMAYLLFSMFHYTFKITFSVWTMVRFPSTLNITSIRHINFSIEDILFPYISCFLVNTVLVGINCQCSYQFCNTLHPFLFIMFLFYIQNTYTFQNYENWNLFVKKTKNQSSWYWKITLILIRKVKSVPFKSFPAMNNTMILHTGLKTVFLKWNRGRGIS